MRSQTKALVRRSVRKRAMWLTPMLFHMSWNMRASR